MGARWIRELYLQKVRLPQLAQLLQVHQEEPLQGLMSLAASLAPSFCRDDNRPVDQAFCQKCLRWHRRDEPCRPLGAGGNSGSGGTGANARSWHAPDREREHERSRTPRIAEAHNAKPTKPPAKQDEPPAAEVSGTDKGF